MESFKNNLIPAGSSVSVVRSIFIFLITKTKGIDFYYWNNPGKPIRIKCQGKLTANLAFLAGNICEAEISYVSFDDPLERNFAVSDPNGFLDRFGNQPVIVDEIQYVPDILPYLKMRIDQDRERYGRFLLTGSQQFQLMKNVSESLAGRIAILELFPFNFEESQQTLEHNLEQAIWAGGYPEPALMPDKRDVWLRSYIQTYIERDIRQLHNVSI